jgi:hypothetical protein
MQQLFGARNGRTTWAGIALDAGPVRATSALLRPEKAADFVAKSKACGQNL